MPELRCQMLGPWRLPEWSSGAAHTCQLTSRGSSVGSCTPREAGIAALLMEKRAKREHMLYLQWVGVGTLLVFLIRQCRWCLLRKGLWGRGDVLTFC